LRDRQRRPGAECRFAPAAPALQGRERRRIPPRLD
jgi:hypothetical protein